MKKNKNKEIYWSSISNVIKTSFSTIIISAAMAGFVWIVQFPIALFLRCILR